MYSEFKFVDSLSLSFLNTTDFYKFKTSLTLARLVLWETDDNYVYDTSEYFWFEEFSDTSCDYFAYDSTTFLDEDPIIFRGSYFASNSLTSLSYVQVWPFFCFNFQTSLGSWFLNTPQILFRFQRRPRNWFIFYGLSLFFFSATFFFLNRFFFLQLSLVGVGFSCESIPNTTKIRLIISNTHDLELIAPANVDLFVLPPKGDNALSTIFCAGSSDYFLLRRYAHYVRQLLKFNVYEYKGLLYLYETKKKKLTKRKVK